MKIERNQSCPCGSGKKYKKCCLLKEQEQAAQEEKDWQAWFKADCEQGDRNLAEYEQALQDRCK